MADVPLGAISCLGREWEQHPGETVDVGRKERDAALHEGSCHLPPPGYLMLLKLSKHRDGTFPNLKHQQHLIINASFNRAANEARTVSVWWGSALGWQTMPQL